MKQGKSIRADDLLQRKLECVQEILLIARSRQIVEKVTDQVRKNFSVGLRAEGVALTDQLIPQLLKILDHPVMDDSELPALIEVRVRVLICHKAMRCPPGVPDPDTPMRRVLLNKLRQTGDPSCTLAEFHSSGRKRCNAGGVISAIFQTAQTINQDWGCFSTANVADYPAHK